ncbi:MAG: hypothetical protein E7620_06020 [Ruminococcaceae bacterium]|nr:hypothetical protein [Oscillospiraceae bacterium]
MKKFSIYGLFHNKRLDSEDVLKEDTTPTLKRFFKLLGRYFWKIVSLNLMMLLMVIPLILAVYLYLVINKTPSALHPIFSQIYGANLIQSTPESSFLLDLFGPQVQIPAYHSTGTYVGIGICIAFAVLTFGWQNVGSTYILRSFVRGEPGFMLSDYFHAIKRNFRQGFFLGLLDAAILFFLFFNISFYWDQMGTFQTDFMFLSNAALLVLYFFMRFYIYHLLITFELSIMKILKNALIFVMLGIKRNLMAALGMLLLTAMVVVLIAFVTYLFGLNMIPIPLMLTLFFYMGATAFMSSYAAYPIIDRYMIAPFVKQNQEESEET